MGGIAALPLLVCLMRQLVMAWFGFVLEKMELLIVTDVGWEVCS